MIDFRASSCRREIGYGAGSGQPDGSDAQVEVMVRKKEVLTFASVAVFWKLAPGRSGAAVVSAVHQRSKPARIDRSEQRILFQEIVEIRCVSSGEASVVSNNAFGCWFSSAA